MQFKITIWAILFALLIIPHHVLYAETRFECGFVQEKMVNGKSNKASCSMDPEKVFSAKYKQKSTKHCDIDEVYVYEDYTNFFVNEKFVSWTSHEALTERAKSIQKKHYLKKGMSEKEADEKVNWKGVTDYLFPIFSHYIQQHEIYLNSLTQKPYKKPPKQKVHLYTFGNNINSFSLYIPEVSGKAILIEYSSMEDSSWATLRFGTCRPASNK
jgi:hypothetical protein